MRDPFVTALEALFRAPGSVAAVYTVLQEDPVPVRAIISRPDQETSFGSSRIVQASYAIELQRSQISEPEPGATLTTDSMQLVLRGEPKLDAEAMTWICGAEEAV